MNKTCNWCAWLCGRDGTTPICGKVTAPHAFQPTEWNKSCEFWKLEPDPHARTDAARRDMGLPLPDVKVLPGTRIPSAATKAKRARAAAKRAEQAAARPKLREKGKSKWGLHEFEVGDVKVWSAQGLGYPKPIILRNLLHSNVLNWQSTRPAVRFQVRMDGDEISIERIA